MQQPSRSPTPSWWPVWTRAIAVMAAVGVILSLLTVLQGWRVGWLGVLTALTFALWPWLQPALQWTGNPPAGLAAAQARATVRRLAGWGVLFMLLGAATVGIAAWFVVDPPAARSELLVVGAAMIAATQLLTAGLAWWCAWRLWPRA